MRIHEFFGKQTIDSQYLDNAVEAVVWESESGTVICEKSRIHLFDSGGVFQRVETTSEVLGCALDSANDLLLISNRDGVSAWKIGTDASKVIPASTRLRRQ